jgi:thermostable 8-oxoguanine DNA glycosylase
MQPMRKTYLTAKTFQIRQIPSVDAKSILESYLALPDKSSEPVKTSELFGRLLASAQNANMKAGVIGGSIGGINNLGKALFSFNPLKVDKTFANDPDGLLKHIVKTLRPRGQIRKTPRSIWPKYCKTILSSAAFFRQFRNGEDFYDWANHLYQDPRSMAALPMIMAAEIEGIGYPLACDFLKELGFVDYGKPDVHVIDIFVGIGLCTKGVSPYHVQKVITQIATAAGVSSYNVDKLFWLIGSGRFYNHPELGNNGLIGRNKEKYIAEFNA